MSVMAVVTCPFGCPWHIDHDDQTALAAHIAAHNQPSQEAPVPDSLPCKIPGCDQPRVDKAGMYGALCATHKAEKQAARLAHKDTVPKLAVVPPNGHVPITLTDLARTVDTAAAEVREAGGRHERAVAALRAALDAHDE